LRARRLAFNAEAVDITDAESAGRWRELLGGAGRAARGVVGRRAVQGPGQRRADAVVFFASEIRDWQVAIPDFGTVTGPFQITALEYAGRHDGEMTFEIAWNRPASSAFAAT
jgi:TP901-1 family phage major tail protein